MIKDQIADCGLIKFEEECIVRRNRSLIESQTRKAPNDPARRTSPVNRTRGD
jgi:hypothetical protein